MWDNRVTKACIFLGFLMSADSDLSVRSGFIASTMSLQSSSALQCLNMIKFYMRMKQQ